MSESSLAKFVTPTKSKKPAASSATILSSPLRSKHELTPTSPSKVCCLTRFLSSASGVFCRRMRRSSIGSFQAAHRPPKAHSCIIWEVAAKRTCLRTNSSALPSESWLSPKHYAVKTSAMATRASCLSNLRHLLQAPRVAVQERRSALPAQTFANSVPRSALRIQFARRT